MIPHPRHTARRPYPVPRIKMLAYNVRLVYYLYSYLFTFGNYLWTPITFNYLKKEFIMGNVSPTYAENSEVYHNI